MVDFNGIWVDTPCSTCQILEACARHYRALPDPTRSCHLGGSRPKRGRHKVGLIVKESRGFPPQIVGWLVGALGAATRSASAMI